MQAEAHLGVPLTNARHEVDNLAMTQTLADPPPASSGRVVAVYCLMGPIPTLLLAAIVGSLGETGTWVLAAFEAVLGLVLYLILKPAVGRRSPWRSALGVVWFTAPLVVMASTSLPSFELLDPSPAAQVFQPRLPEVWATLWVACGYCACFLAAIASAIPGRDAPAPQPIADAAAPEAGASPIAAADTAGPPRVMSYVRFALVLGTLVTTGLVAVPTYMFLSFGAALSRSHIDGNVPIARNFDAYLARDLNAYFSAGDSGFASVRYELLRRQPTQTGVSFPRYYAWVRIRHWDRGPDQGVVRVSAIDRERFEVNRYLTSEAAISQPEVVQDEFPPALIDEIQHRARAARR